MDPLLRWRARRVDGRVYPELIDAVNSVTQDLKVRVLCPHYGCIAGSGVEAGPRFVLLWVGRAFQI